MRSDNRPPGPIDRVGPVGIVHSVSLGNRRGVAKSRAHKIMLIADYGVEGDAHAGPGDRQVGLIAFEDVQALKELGVTAEAGDFAENMTIKGLDFTLLTSRTRLAVGKAVLEITERGKPEWKEGDYSFHGVPLMARKGVFARVIQGGIVEPGDKIFLLDAVP